MASTEPTPLPKGMRYCPRCNGDGEVWVMDGTPDLNETVYPCDFPGCEEGQGIVPMTRAQGEE